MISYYEQYDALAYHCIQDIKKLLDSKNVSFVNSAEYNINFPYVITFYTETLIYDERLITCVALYNNELYLYCKTGTPSYYKGLQLTEAIKKDLSGNGTGWYKADDVVGREYRFELFDCLHEILK